jgi:transposase
VESAQPSAVASVRKHHSAEFIANIVKLVKVDGLPVAQVSRQSGIRANQVYRWIRHRELQAARQDPTSNESRELELARLQRENQHLKKQVDFLKKAAAYFAHENVSCSSAYEIATENTK